MECPRCGSVVTPGVSFCPECGAGLAEPAGIAAAAAATTEIDTAATRAALAARPAVATDATGLRTCPACAAPNSAHRELCGRCGADLDTGQLPPRPAVGPTLAVTPDADPKARHVPRWVWVGAGAVLVALLVGAMALFGVGPFAPRAPEAPSFDPAVYPGEPAPLVLSDIATLTVSEPRDGRSFEPLHMVDDDLLTAWVSDHRALPEGANHRIDLFLEEPAWVERLVLATGDQFDDEHFRDFARIRRVQLTLDGGLTYVLNFLDERGVQAVEFRNPQLTTTVRLEVLDVFDGRVSDDIAIADLDLEGWVASDADAALARQRAAVRRATGPSGTP